MIVGSERGSGPVESQSVPAAAAKVVVVYPVSKGSRHGLPRAWSVKLENPAEAYAKARADLPRSRWVKLPAGMAARWIARGVRRHHRQKPVARALAGELNSTVSDSRQPCVRRTWATSILVLHGDYRGLLRHVNKVSTAPIASELRPDDRARWR